LAHLFIGGLVCQTENKNMAKTAALIEILHSAFVYYLSTSEFVERKFFWIDSLIFLLLGLMMGYVGFSDDVQKVLKKTETKGQSGHEVKIE
jgi:putative Mn2+ efflux pump MntP